MLVINYGIFYFIYFNTQATTMFYKHGENLSSKN